MKHQCIAVHHSVAPCAQHKFRFALSRLSLAIAIGTAGGLLPVSAMAASCSATNSSNPLTAPLTCTITAASDSITLSNPLPNAISTPAAMAHAIWATQSFANATGNITITNSGPISTLGNGANGILADFSGGNATGNINITNTGNITTAGTGIYSNGIFARYLRTASTQSGDIVINTNGDITASGGNPGNPNWGIVAEGLNGLIDITAAGNIRSDSHNAIEANANQDGSDIIVKYNSGTIDGYLTGLIAQVAPLSGRVSVITQPGTQINAGVTTSQGTHTTGGSGIFVYNGNGNATGDRIAVDSASNITSRFSGIHTYFAASTVATNAPTYVTSAGNLTLSAAGSLGIEAESAAGDVFVGYADGGAEKAVKGNITASGNAIRAQLFGTAPIAGTVAAILYDDAASTLASTGAAEVSPDIHTLYADTNTAGSTANARVIVRNVSSVTAAAPGGAGLAASSLDGNAIVEFNAGSIAASGANGFGISAEVAGIGNASITTAGTVGASGAGSFGIRSTSTTGQAVVTNTGSVKGVAAGISLTATTPAAGSKIDNTGAAAKIEAVNDLAISTAVTSGAFAINNSGSVIGVVTTTAANDTFNNLAGGTWLLRQCDATAVTCVDPASSFGTGANVITNAGLITVPGATGTPALIADENQKDPTITLGAGNALQNNGGTLMLQNSYLGNWLTVDGDFVSNGGSLALDTVLDNGTTAAGSGTDVLHITGSLSNTSPITLSIANIGGTGALTTGNGILVVQVDGATSAPSAFQLSPASITVGQYVYTLHQVGKNWYLQSTLQSGGAAPAPIPTLGGWSLAGLIAALPMLTLAWWRRRTVR